MIIDVHELARWSCPSDCPRAHKTPNTTTQTQLGRAIVHGKIDYSCVSLHCNFWSRLKNLQTKCRSVSPACHEKLKMSSSSHERTCDETVRVSSGTSTCSPSSGGVNQRARAPKRDRGWIDTAKERVYGARSSFSSHETVSVQLHFFT